MKKHDGKTKLGDKIFIARKKQSIDIPQELPVKQSHTLFLKSQDTIEIEITGKELLEAIEYGGTEDNTDS